MNHIVTGEAPEVVIEVIEGDASVRGWSRLAVDVAIDPRKIELTQSENSVRMRLHASAAIQLPAGSRLRIERVDGDLAVNGVTGSLFLGKVNGDVGVRNTGPLTIEHIEGDLGVRSVQGDCAIGQVRRDASVAHVRGDLKIGNVGDDLSVSGLHGSLHAVAADDISVRFDPRPGCTYDVRAGKNLDCRFPSISSAKLTLSAGESIRTRGLTTPVPEGNDVAFQIGAGEAIVNLAAGKRLSLRGAEAWVDDDFSFEFGPEAAERWAELAQQVQEQVGAVARQVEEKINNMGGSEEIATRIQESILAAARRAEAKINETIRSAEQRTDEAQRRAADAEMRQRSRGRNWGAPPPPMPPSAPRTPVSENERILILKMVGDGSITVEQAEQLLAALGGKAGAGD